MLQTEERPTVVRVPKTRQGVRLLWGWGGWFSHGLAAPIPFSQDLTTGLGWERREASGTSWKVLRT